MNDQAADNWNPEAYRRNAAFVADLGADLLDWLAPAAHERILDLGCGDGVLTARLDRLADAVGVDASPAMVAAAQSRGLDARVMDGQALSFRAEFDAVFSNAALHWMRRPEAVIEGVTRALKPGGRFVGELGGRGNVATIVAALEAAIASRGLEPALFPWYFPREDEFRALLEQGGLRIERLAFFPRPTPLPGDARGWLETFSHPYTAGFDLQTREAVIADAAERLRPLLMDSSGRWIADYVRLRFRARKPA